MSSDQPGDGIRMSPEEERAATQNAPADEATEPADEGLGVHTDADADPHHTEN